MRFGLRHIRYFIAVAEELHFRRAADRLCIAQPALSRAIRSLENDLGVQLFDRSSRSITMTPAGQTFLDGCLRIVTSVEHLVEETRQVNEGQIGALQIGYTDTAISGVLPSRLKEFQDLHPGINLKPHHDVTSKQLDKLDQGILDVGFVTGPVTRPGYEQCIIQSERFVCVVYDSHPLAGQGTIRLDQLAGENIVHGASNEWQHFHSYLIPMCRRAGFELSIAQEAYNTAGILGLVACGMGVTLLTDSVRNAIIPGLTVLELNDVDEQLHTLAIWRADAANASQSFFADFLMQARLEPSAP